MKRLFQEVSREFLDNIDVKKSSMETYKSVLSAFSVWVVRVGRNIKMLRRADILAYKSYLISENKSEKTIGLYMAVLRCFYEYLEQVGEHENIAAGIRLKNQNKDYTKAHLSLDEVSTLLQSIDRESMIGKRDYAMVNLMVRTGMRCVEVSSLRICDIKEKGENYILHIQRKGRNTRNEKLSIPANVITPIHEYLTERNPASEMEPVFLSLHNHRTKPLKSKIIGRMIGKRMKAAGVYSSEKTAHSLRHTAAVHALLKGATVKEVQTMLGHSSLNTTEIYFKSVNEELKTNNGATLILSKIF